MTIKLMIATPAYSGRVHATYCSAIAETCALLGSKGIGIQLHIPTSGSLLAAERNRILRHFVNSECTHLLCIDSDLAWPAVAVEALLKHNVDFVGGCYPARQENTFLFRPCNNPDGSLVTNGISLVKMEYIPAGFMMIRKAVIEKMQEVHADRYFKPKGAAGEDGYALFNTEVYEGEFWGEDYVFCRLVREAGFDIWVDPAIQFNHDGKVGMLAQVLTNDRAESKAASTSATACSDATVGACGSNSTTVTAA